MRGRTNDCHSAKKKSLPFTGAKLGVRSRVRPSSFLRILTLLTALLCTGSSRAEERPSLTLDYRIAASAKRCPAEQTFRDRVAARLGFDPFSQSSGRSAHVGITPGGNHGELLGHLALRHGGKTIGQRTLRGVADQCDELAQALAIALSVMLDPFGEFAPNAKPPEPEATSPAKTVPATKPTTRRRTPEMRSRETSPEKERFLRLTTDVAALGSLGFFPGPSVGVRPSVGASLSRNVSTGLEGRFERPPGAVEVSQDRVTSSLFLGGVYACFHPKRAFSCLSLAMGQFRAKAETIPDASSRAAAVAFLSLRAGPRLVLTETFALSPFVEVHAALLRGELIIDQREVWRAPPLAASLGFAATGEWW